jgi:hypothetical protein
MPEGTELLAYDVHVSANGEPATISVNETDESCSTVIWELVAVKGPIDAGVEGTVRATPDAGIVLGNVRLKFSVPVVSVAGVAPATSSCPVAEPDSVGEIPDAAVASELGRFTLTW